jgi:CHRD domain
MFIQVVRKLIFLSMVIAMISSCSNDDNSNVVPTPTVVKDWTIPLSATYENPAPASRTETGTATMQLLSDNSLKYTITLVGLAGADVLTAAHLHVGDAITSGGVILGIDPLFSGSTANGTITGLRASLVDSLKNSANEIYFNVHSTQVPSGLVRGQVNTNIELAADLELSGANEVPPVTTTATGKALVRLTSEKKLYVKLTITNLEGGDALTAAHIHKAATGVNGSVLVGFYGSAADFGTTKIITVDDAAYASLKADNIYANAHSTNHPAGIVRAQIR